MQGKPRSEVRVADALDVSRLLGPESVTTTITSPPYGGLKDYGAFGQIGFRQREKQYFVDLAAVFRGCFRVTKPSGTLWIMVDRIKEQGSANMLPWRLANLVGDVGWNLVDVIVWNKLKSLPYTSRLGIRHQFEYILMFSKGRRPRTFPDRLRDPFDLPKWWRRYPERHHPKGTAPTDIWSYRIPTQGEWGSTYVRHMCPFPPELVERILLLTTNVDDMVLDPFAGSCIVPAVAGVMRRRYFGIEVNERFVREFHVSVMPGIRRWWRTRNRESEKRLRFLKWREAETWKLRKLKLGSLVAKAIANLPTGEQVDWVCVRPGRSRREVKITLHSNHSADKALAVATSLVKVRPASWFELDIHFEAVVGRPAPLEYASYNAHSFLRPIGTVGALSKNQANGMKKVMLASPLVPDIERYLISGKIVANMGGKRRRSSSS